MIKTGKAIIWKDNKILLLKRSSGSEFFPSLWDFPGGKMKEGEDVIKALLREVKEETQLDVVPKDEKTEHYYTEKGNPIHFQVFLVKEFSGNVQLSKDHTEYKWVHHDEIQNYELAPVVGLAMFSGVHP